MKVNVGYENENLKVFVANSGPKIRSDELSLLFKPYQKLSTARNKEGNGLGLYISKKIASEIHGSIDHFINCFNETEFSLYINAPRHDGIEPQQSPELETSFVSFADTEVNWLNTRT